MSKCCLWRVGLRSILGILLGTTVLEYPAIAQLEIIPDTAPGRNLGTQVQRNGVLDLVTGGTRPQNGANLFHSFQEFNVQEGRGVYFASPEGVQNILSRVTGSDRSDILGTLGTFRGDSARVPGVDLFLINPNGFVFGSNSSLDVGGSFFVTTANAIQLGERGLFSASQPESSNLLTIAPSAFLFNSSNASTTQASIRLDPFASLGVLTSQSIVLLGGNIQIDGGGITAPGGRIEIGAILGDGTIGLNPDRGLNLPDGIERADILFDRNTIVDVTSSDRGDISVTARNISVLGQSSLFAGLTPEIGTDRPQAGDISLNATEAIQLSGSSQVTNLVLPNAIGKAGSVRIIANSLEMTDGAQTAASVLGKGDTGNVEIKAHDRVLISGNQTGIFNSVEKDGEGIGGDLVISANALQLSNDAQLSTSIEGKGRAGDILINVRDGVLLNNSAIFTRVEQGAEGNGGDLLISANDLQLSNNAQLVANTRGKGDAGNISINIRGRILLDDSAIFTRVNPGGEGNGGDLLISASTLELNDATDLVANTGGKGNAGDISINVRGHISINDSGIFSNVDQGGEGSGGNLLVSANSLELSNGAQLVANTRGKGNAGNVLANVSEYIFLNDSQTTIFTNVDTSGQGDGGNLLISTKTLAISDGAQLFTGTIGLGNSGNIFLGKDDQPINSISISGTSSNLGRSSGLLAFTNSGRGGNIQIIANRFRLSDGAVVDARTGSIGSSGTITLRSDTVEILRGSQILSITQGSGSADRVTVNAKQLLISGTDPTFEQRLREFPDGRVAPISSESGIYTRSIGSGSAGSISIAGSRIELNDRARVDAQSATIDGGNISITASNLLLLRNNSQISASAGTAQAGGNGGSVDINARFVIAIPKENSDISANAFRGSGGKVTILTQSGILGLESRARSTPLSDITASSEIGISGSVTINTPDTSILQNSLTQLPQNAIDTNILLANSCIARTTRSNSTFYKTGSGGLPTRPEDAPLSAYSTGEIRSTNAVSRPWQKGDAIAEPHGVYQLPNGKLFLSRECPNE